MHHLSLKLGSVRLKSRVYEPVERQMSGGEPSSMERTLHGTMVSHEGFEFSKLQHYISFLVTFSLLHQPPG